MTTNSIITELDEDGEWVIADTNDDDPLLDELAEGMTDPTTLDDEPDE